MIEVQNDINRLILIVAISMVITTLVAIAVAVFVARATTQPIRQLTQVARRIASGELGQKIPFLTIDESGQLAEAFNEMLLVSKVWWQRYPTRRVNWQSSSQIWLMA